MDFPDKISLVFCLAFFLSGCEGKSDKANNAGNVVLPLENTATEASPTILDESQLEILERIKQRSSNDGALYQFDQLNPVFEQDGDTITVNFEYINPDTVGGAPIVKYSVVQNTITSIVYTQ